MCVCYEGVCVLYEDVCVYVRVFFMRTCVYVCVMRTCVCCGAFSGGRP